MPKKRLGEVLVELGIINDDQLHTALEHSKKWKKKLGQSLVENHFITEAQLVGALSSHLGIPMVDLLKLQVTDQLLRCVPSELAQKHEVFPAGMGREGARAILKVAMSDPTNFNAITEIEFATGYKIQPVLAEISQITHMIRRHYLKIDLEPINIGGASFDSMSQYFPAEMNLVNEGKVTKAGTGQFQIIPEDTPARDLPGTKPASAPALRPPAGAPPASAAEPSRPPTRDAIAARPGDEVLVDAKLMALLKLLIDKRVISKEEYLAELQILLARKGQK